MLILTRRPNESLHIGDNIVITVLGIKGNQVCLGITAPKDVVVDREEVHQRKLAERALTPTSDPKASRPRAADSPSASEPEEKPAAGFSSEPVNQVRIGITAPRDVVIDRAEIHHRKQREPAAPGHALDPDATPADRKSAVMLRGESQSRPSLPALTF